MATLSGSDEHNIDPSKDANLAVYVIEPDGKIQQDRGDAPQQPVRVPLFRSTRFQAAVLFGVFFCGPGMYGALNALGAGGLQSPTLVNITSGMSYGMNVVFALLTGVFVNLLGERLTLSIGVCGFSVYGAALYCNNRFGDHSAWFLYFSSAIQGFTTAILW